MSAELHNILSKSYRSFNIIEEFAALEAKRKMILCDHLFSEGFQSFQSMVQLLWPECQFGDIKKLEKFLILLKNTAH